MNSRDYYTKMKFQDNDKFPYGISRSGDFSLEESEFLTQKGCLYKALFENQLLNPIESDIRMIKVYKGEIEASTFEEKTWLKYMKYKKRSPVWLCDEEKVLGENSDIDYIDDDIIGGALDCK